MGIFEKIRSHAAIASGNFASMFKNIEVPPLPAVATRLISEFNRAEPDMQEITKIISSDLEISSKVIRTVNSSLFGLPNQIKSIQQAIPLLGLRSIRTIALSYAMKKSLPKPSGKLFNHEAFWADSLARALLARSLTHYFRPGEKDEVFTAMLLADIALPVLLSVWSDYYSPIFSQWRDNCERLSQIERKDFGWDHAQAGAWILKSWDFPDEFVCLVGVHNLTIDELKNLGLEKTIALPLAVASLLPSVLKPDEKRAKLMNETIMNSFAMPEDYFRNMVAGIQISFAEMRDHFDLKDQKFNIFELVLNCTNWVSEEQNV